MQFLSCVEKSCQHTVSTIVLQRFIKNSSCFFIVYASKREIFYRNYPSSHELTIWLNNLIPTNELLYHRLNSCSAPMIKMHYPSYDLMVFQKTNENAEIKFWDFRSHVQMCAIHIDTCLTQTHKYCVLQPHKFNKLKTDSHFSKTVSQQPNWGVDLFKFTVYRNALGNTIAAIRCGRANRIFVAIANNSGSFRGCHGSKMHCCR